MRQVNLTVVYAFKNADGNEIVLKHEVPTSQVVQAYQDLIALSQKILDSESSD
jgi:hypothetical protein